MPTVIHPLSLKTESVSGIPGRKKPPRRGRARNAPRLLYDEYVPIECTAGKTETAAANTPSTSLKGLFGLYPRSSPDNDNPNREGLNSNQWLNASFDVVNTIQRHEMELDECEWELCHEHREKQNRILANSKSLSNNKFGWDNT
ncbi:hypothetical protein FQN53_000793 [Emmonsiellopsis sp. PD_33]|nr:hypothetical protein FQN53_000793 [Emmonsiellopsis sp. PD_33]